MYELNGNMINNPIIRENDIITVSYVNNQKYEVEASISHDKTAVFVTGFVLHPSGHKFIAGYRIRDYIAMSGGITDYGDLKKVLIYRNSKALEGDNVDMLQPGDQIHIPSNIKYRLLGNMSFLQTVTSIMTLYLTFLAANP